MPAVSARSCWSLVLGMACLAIAEWPASAKPNDTTPLKEGNRTQALVISVHPTSAVPDRDVLVSDIASVQGGDPELQRRIAGLDLAGPPAPGRPLVIPRQLIVYRIQLAGIDSDQFQVKGSPRVLVSLGTHTVSPEEIFRAARQAVLRRLPWNQADVDTRLAQPLHSGISIPGVTKEQLELKATLASDRVSLGRVRVDVGVYANQALKAKVPVYLQVQVYQQVPLVNRRVERSQPFTRDNVYFERRLVSSLVDYPSEAELVGKRARRTLLPLHPVRRSDLASQTAGNSAAIRQRDVVQLVAKKGALRVTARGEAVQSGRVGDLIKVRNANSKVVVLARVVSKSVVEVLF